MPLCSPVIVGPLTEWSSSVLVLGCIPGAKVEVLEIALNPRVVAKGNAKGGSDRFTLVLGQQLKRYDILVARQELGGDKSAIPDFRMGMWVGPAPATTDEMPALEFVSRPYECGGAVSIGGAIPGALVQVSKGVTILGTAIANEGVAIVPVSRLPGAGNTIEVVAMPPIGYTVSGSSKITSIITEHAPSTDSLKLPMPQLDQAFPVQGCNAGIQLRGLVDGATVTLERRDAGISSTYLPTASETTLILNPVLSHRAEQLHIRQSLVDCHRTDSDNLVVDVAEAARPGPLSALPPCAWSSTIFATDVEGGAIITVIVQGTSYRAMAPADSNSMLLQIDPIPINSQINMLQENCAGPSDPFAFSTVDNLPLKACTVIGPLYACARGVRVIDAMPGSLIQIWACLLDETYPRPISNFIPVTYTSMMVLVAPYLVKDQLIYVQYLACGGDWKASKKEPVIQIGHVLPVSIIGIENDHQVVINDGLPGARIDLYALSGNTREFLGRGVIDPLNQHVSLNRTLTRRDQLIVHQTLCNTFDHSPIQEVLPAEKIFLLAAPLRSWSTVAPYDKFLEVDMAELRLSHSGENELKVHARNTEEEADVDYVFDATLHVTNRPGEKWQRSVADNLSAAGNGPATLVGYRIHGIPSQAPVSTPVAIDQRLLDIKYWRDILQSNGHYRIMHCFFKRPPEAEPDDPDE